MKPYIVAPQAEDDLRQIWRYLLGEAGPAIANRVQGELVDAFEGFGPCSWQRPRAFRPH